MGLPRGLRGVDQQADQHGILRLVRLSLHELLLQPRRPSPPWFRGSLQEGVERGARPRHEVYGVPDHEGRPRRLPGHRQAHHDGLGQPTGSHGGRARAREDGQPEPARHPQGGWGQGRRSLPLLSISFLLECLLSSLSLLAFSGLGGGGLDDTHSDGLPHVTDSKPSKGRELGERLDAHGLTGCEHDNSSITRFDELGVAFGGLTSTTINLLLDLGKLACDMCSVTIQDWAVSIGDLSRVIQDNDLSSEVLNSRSWLVLRVRGNVTSLDVLHRHVLDVKANIVSGSSLGEGLVVHLNGLNLSGQHVGGKSDDHAGLDDSSLDTAHWHCSNTSNFVDILKGKPKRLVCRSRWWDDGIKSFEQSGTAGLAFLALNVPSLVPGHVGAGLQHVVSVPAGDGDEWNSNWVVSDLLDEVPVIMFLMKSLCPGASMMVT